MNPYRTMQQLATSVGVSRRQKVGGMLEQTPRASGVKKAGTVLGGSKVELPKNDAPTLAELPSMSNRQRHDLLALIKGDLIHRTRKANHG